MSDPDQDRWKTARSEVVTRWRQVLERVDARDEGGALALSAEMDEFCDEAIAERDRTEGGASQAAQPAPTVKGPSGPPQTMCHFCRGFVQYGGCSGLTQQFNRAVLSGDWDEARTLAERYIGRLQGLDFPAS